MNFLKRSLLNLKYKKMVSVVIIVLFILIAEIIITALCIRTGTVKSEEIVRKQLGGSVKICSANTIIGSNMVPDDLAAKLKGLSHVKSYNFVSDMYAYAFDFKPVLNNAPLKGALKSNGDTILSGVTNSSLLSDFSEENCKLVQGRNITKADEGKAVIMIEQTLLEQDKLKIGDKISFNVQNGSDKKTVALTIVGVYRRFKTDYLSSPAIKLENTMYIPLSVLLSLSSNKELNYAEYFVDDPLNINAIKKNITKTVKIPAGCKIKVQCDDYASVVRPLVSLKAIATIILIGVIIAGAAILSLMVVLALKGRNYEIGILLSIGEKKSKVVMQMVIEILIPVFIAFSMSIIIGKFTVTKVGNSMIKDQITMQGDTTIVSSNLDSTDNSPSKMLKKVNIGITAMDLIKIYCAGIILVLISAAVPVITVMRYNPKTILTRIE